MDFDSFIQHTLKIEGGYVNDPLDPGGETNFGISKRSYPNIDIKNLTKEAAIEIYRQDFWQAARINELPPIIAYTVFDMAVNAGPRTAIKLLQRCLRLKADGRIGPITLSAARSVDKEYLKRYTQARIKYYRRLAGSRPSLMKFLYGWNRRANLSEKQILDFYKENLF